MPATVHTEQWFADAVCALLPELVGTARRLTGSGTDAEDLVADAVAKAWAHHHTLRDRDTVRAWLFRILHNTYISQRRSAAQHTLDATVGEEDFSLFERLHQPILLWWSNPEQQFLNRLLREDLARALGSLAEPFRTCVVLCDVEGRSYGEIAATLDVAVGTVKSRLARGRAQLQRALWQHAHDMGLCAPDPPAGDAET